MYRAALLCALLLLVSASSPISAVTINQKLFEAPKHVLAPEPDRAPLLLLKQTDAAPAAGNVASDAASNVIQAKSIYPSAAAQGTEAAPVPAPAKDVAGAAEQQQQKPAAAAQPTTQQQQQPASSLPAPQQHQQQQQSKPAAAAPTPTVAQPAAPQLAANLNVAAPAQQPQQAQPQPQAQAQAPQQPAPVAAQQQPAPVAAQQQPTPVAAQKPAPAAAQQPAPAAAVKPAPQQPQPAAPKQPQPTHAMHQDELLSSNSQAQAMGHHSEDSGAPRHYRSGVQHSNSHPKTGTISNTEVVEGNEGWSTYEPPEYRHHTGKAAKKLYRAYQDTEDAEMAAADRLQRLQKYYDADLLGAEDEGVSSFARPTSGAAQHYSSKAAKYAAQALKAQQKAQAKGAQLPTEAPIVSSNTPAQQQQAPQSTGLAGFAAALLRKAAADKPATTTTTSPSKPTLKSEPVSAPEQTEEMSFEEYMATPEGAKLLAHEQHRTTKRQQAAAKKQATQMLRQTSSRVYADGRKHATAGRIADADDDLFADADDEYYSRSNGYGDADYEEYLAKKYGKKYADIDPMDTNNVKHSKIAMKGMRDTVLFRTIPNTVKQNVGYTVAPAAQITVQTMATTTQNASADANRPVMLTFEAELTCGDATMNPMGIGTCYGNGMLPQNTATTQQAQMFWTCTITADASTLCGLRYMQGMTITAQGPATVVLTNGDTPYSIKADVNAITGAYAPGRRATLLGDVLTLLSGVKGGSLAIDVKQVNGQMQGMFNFFFWR